MQLVFKRCHKICCKEVNAYVHTLRKNLNTSTLIFLSPVVGVVLDREYHRQCCRPERTLPGDPGSSLLLTQPVAAREDNL